MELGEHISKYLLAFQVGSHGVKWTLLLETSGGRKHELTIPASEVAAVLDLVRGDLSLYFNPETRTLCTGWNEPGA